MVDTQNQLDQRIQTSFEKATTQRKKLETQSTRFTVSGVILSSLATLVAGIPSILGQTIIGDWRLTCAIAALIALAATIVAGVQNLVSKPDLLTRTSECVGRLRLMLIELQSGNVDADQVSRQYQTLLFFSFR